MQTCDESYRQMAHRQQQLVDPDQHLWVLDLSVVWYCFHHLMGVVTSARDVAIDDYGLCTSEDLQRGWLPSESDYNKIQMGGSYGIREPSNLKTCDHIVSKGNVSWWFVVACNPAVTSDKVF